MKNRVLITLLVFFLNFGFNRIEAQTVKDIDGNVYKTIAIGNQVWMAENLKTTKYNDGSTITMVTDNSTWEASTIPAYCFYDNDVTAYKNKYGALYNWFAVNTKKLCPVGWHIPSDNEWTNLPPMAGGYRYSDGTFYDIKNASYWWTATESSIRTSYYRGVWWDGTGEERDEVNKRVGYSVRCVKN